MIGETYFFKLDFGAVYTGEIIEVDEIVGNSFINIVDKFGNRVGFRESSIIKYNQESQSKPKNIVHNKSSQLFEGS